MNEEISAYIHCTTFSQLKFIYFIKCVCVINIINIRFFFFFAILTHNILESNRDKMLHGEEEGGKT